MGYGGELALAPILEWGFLRSCIGMHQPQEEEDAHLDRHFVS